MTCDCGSPNALCPPTKAERRERIATAMLAWFARDNPDWAIKESVRWADLLIAELDE